MDGCSSTGASTRIVPLGNCRHGTGIASSFTQRQAVLYEIPCRRAHSTNFTLPGQGLQPGQRVLIVDLATNTHEDIESTVQQVKIDYEPTTPKPAPAPAAPAGKPEVKVTAPTDGATVGPKFQIKVQPTNFTPMLEMEGKQNLPGVGHYHVFVDMDMSAMNQRGGMMSMAGMIGMPGSNTIDVDLSAWKNGKHTITVEPVQDDHTPIDGAKAAMFTINLQGARGQ